MTEPFPADSDVDIAGQAEPVDDIEDNGTPTGDFVGTIEANPVDVFEQQRSVPLDDEEHPAS